jgi:hypothetical protein
LRGYKGTDFACHLLQTRELLEARYLKLDDDALNMLLMLQLEVIIPEILFTQGIESVRVSHWSRIVVW